MKLEKICWYSYLIFEIIAKESAFKFCRCCICVEMSPFRYCWWVEFNFTSIRCTFYAWTFLGQFQHWWRSATCSRFHMAVVDTIAAGDVAVKNLCVWQLMWAWYIIAFLHILLLGKYKLLLENENDWEYKRKFDLPNCYYSGHMQWPAMHFPCLRNWCLYFALQNHFSPMTARQLHVAFSHGRVLW